MKYGAHTTTTVRLGMRSSEAYLLQIFNRDSRIPGLVEELFEATARHNGSSARLRTSTSEVIALASEVFEKDFDYAGWLSEAIDEAEREWVNMPEEDEDDQQ